MQKDMKNHHIGKRKRYSSGIWWQLCR